jgi:aminoglycoside 6'-N-acetyltransferase
MEEPGLHFRRLARSDFPRVVSWLAQPHVAEWWGTPLGLVEVEAQYGPCVDGTDPTMVFVGAQGSTDFALVQIYRLADNPAYAQAVGVPDGAGIDLLIGDPSLCGRGWGTRIIVAALEMGWNAYPDVRWAMAGPSVRNIGSQRAFAKAGFRAERQVRVPDEEDDEMILVCPRPTAA